MKVWEASLMTVACKDCTLPNDVAINWLEGTAMKALMR